MYHDISGYNGYNKICRSTLWNCINAKYKNTWFKLNDEKRKPFESADDKR